MMKLILKKALMPHLAPGKLTNPSAVPGDDDYEIIFNEDLYNKFKFDIDLNPWFPIEDFKDQIIEMIEANPVLLI